jgi:hypothetical protein
VETVQSLLEGELAVGTAKLQKHKSFGQTISIPEVYLTDTLTHV